MAKKIRVALICLILIMIACVAMACDENKMPEKMAFDEVLTNTNNQEDKSIDSHMTASFIAYNTSGKPGKIEESLDIMRIMADGAYYMYGELRTSELTNIMENIVTLIYAALNMSGTSGGDLLRDYLTGKTYIAGRSGLKDDTLNGQVVRCEDGEEPLFEFAADGSDILAVEKAWGAIKYSDFIAFKDSLEIDSVTNADFLEMLYSAFSLPIDWNSAVDSATANFVKIKGKKFAEYDLVYSSDKMVEYFKEMIQRYFEEVFGDDEETYEMLMDYYDRYVDFAFEIFKVSDLHTVATVDTGNRLVTMNADFGIKLEITDDQVLKILDDEEVDDDGVRKVKSILKILHGFFGCSTQEKGKFEFELQLAMSDTYSYGEKKIDTTTNLYLPFDENNPARATAVWVADEEGEYDWDFTFPEKVQEFLDGKRPPEPEGDDGGSDDNPPEEGGEE